MRTKKVLFLLAVTTISILFIQCEKKPTDQIEIANTLIKKMQTEESSHYAPEKYEMAMNYYQQAQELMEKKDYKKAAVQFEYCINVANAALSKTQNEKENEKYNQEKAKIVYSDTVETEEAPVVSEEKITKKPEYTTEKDHIVQAGESLSSISKKYFDTEKYWINIYDANANSLKNPNLILPGQTLKIPSIRTKVVLKENEYQVKKGETLWFIAENLYPDSEINHWNTLYRENKSKIFNPNLLKCGTILTVPNLNQFAYTPGDTTYLVKKGDSFWSIAQMINNLDPSKTVTWQEIYQLNGDLVTDANTIYPDNLIHLP